VIDIGGVHKAETASIEVDTLGLTKGRFTFDMFQTERHTEVELPRRHEPRKVNCGTIAAASSKTRTPII
jgi:hypothetical protein